MFERLVAIEPVSLIPAAQEELRQYAKEVVLYEDIPGSEDEIAERIGDADGVLVSYTSQISRKVLEKCPNVRYVGMCCSLYSESSANVDIAYAREMGIQVLGIRDYGDRGVVEYVLYQLIRILHGFDFPMWQKEPLELTKLSVGIIGLGVSGSMVADALQMMGAQVSYYSRTRKPEKEAAGIEYLPLNELLSQNQVIITCLNKNVILLHEEQFQCLGNKKILMNTSIGTASDRQALAKWLDCKDNLYCCDTEAAIGDPSGELIKMENVICMKTSVGRTRQAFELLSKKVLDNIRLYLGD
ncbi:MAG: dihydrofolate reductase [Lachnospiraceae bacterium]|jgi:lactate dehydrogenase-like 2-hydroxyacid dehydrogenase|nr:dihydrofolate reductase [Lachnospiraceae bacterium]